MITTIYQCDSCLDKVNESDINIVRFESVNKNVMKLIELKTDKFHLCNECMIKLVLFLGETLRRKK